MSKLFTLLLLLCSFFVANAQSRPFGQIDTADLKLTSCDFEKDANAMLLLDECSIHYTFGVPMVAERHKRLKIFNAHANDMADISFLAGKEKGTEWLKSLQAETINLNNGKIEVIKLDKKAVIVQKVNKWIFKYTFSFPAVRAGSVLDYSYSETLPYGTNIPDWDFQGRLPIKYSQIKISIQKGFNCKHYLDTTQSMVVNTDTLLAMANVHSLSEEPLMNSYYDNLQRASFVLVSDNAPVGKTIMNLTWQDLGADLIYSKTFGQQLKIKLKDEDKIIDQVKNLAPEGKIAFIFNKVRDAMDSDENVDMYLDWPLDEAWTKKRGNANVVNMIVCRLLTSAGVVTCPVVVSTDADKRIDPRKPWMKHYDKVMACATIDGKNYVFDASDKDNHWFETPLEVLNTFGLYINVETPAAGLIFIHDDTPAKDLVFVNAEITADGKMSGSTQISSNGFNKEFKRLMYEKLGDIKYKELLIDANNDLKIDSIQFQNKEKDTIPLIQNIKFRLNLPASDENYIYFNPNIFTLLKRNPFSNETRYSSVDFTYCKYYSINGRYKVPQGFNVTAIPSNIDLVMPDKSISFKRICAGDNEFVQVHYVINFRKSLFTKDEYPALHEFYKKMYDLLNEQIVLKKG